MTRQEQLRFCNVCSYQKFDTDKGIICSITNAPAAFEVECTLYKENSELKHKMEMNAIRNELSAPLASKGKRFLNHVIDRVAMVFLAIFLVAILGINIEESDINTLTDLIASAIIAFFYYTLLEASTGRSIGKLLTKTKVVDMEGNKPGIDTIMIRSLCRIVPFNALSFLFSDEGWHDKWSKTKVVEVK